MPINSDKPWAIIIMLFNFQQLSNSAESAENNNFKVNMKNLVVFGLVLVALFAVRMAEDTPEKNAEKFEAEVSLDEVEPGIYKKINDLNYYIVYLCHSLNIC